MKIRRSDQGDCAWRGFIPLLEGLRCNVFVPGNPGIRIDTAIRCVVQIGFISRNHLERGFILVCESPAMNKHQAAKIAESRNKGMCRGSL